MAAFYELNYLPTIEQGMLEGRRGRKTTAFHKTVYEIDVITTENKIKMTSRTHHW